MISAEILEHSIAVSTGAEAITMRVVLPRIVLAEFGTHRKFARNTSSSRAIPITKMIRHALDNQFFPVYWGKNQSGMQAKEQLTGIRLWLAKKAWRAAGIIACNTARVLNKIGVHKQISNRLIENFTYVTVIFTTSDLYNFLALRDHPDAQPEIAELAKQVKAAYATSVPKYLKSGEWHLPLVTDAEKQNLDIDTLIKISAARCASTSYVTVDGKEITADVALRIEQKLTNSDPIHASPFEHQLTPDSLVDIEWRKAGSKKKLQTAVVWARPDLHGNTIGWIQNRKLMTNESQTLDHGYMLTIK